MTPHPAGPWPRSWSQLWELTNRERPVEPRAVRVACLALLAGYGAIALLRHDPAHPEFGWVRGLVCAVALAGSALAGRCSWNGLRALAAGLAVLVSFAAGYVGNARGNGLADVAFTGLATFAPLPFLLTSRDLVRVVVALTVGHGIVLATLPATIVPVGAVASVIGGSIIAGALASLLMNVTRGGLRESMAWWQQACERERLLREFGETTAALLHSPALLDRLAEHFATALGDARCCIVLAPDGRPFTVEGVAGFDPSRAAVLRYDALSPQIDALIRQVVQRRQAIVREGLSDADRQVIAQRWGQPITARSLVALPVTVDEVVAGVVVLTTTAPRQLDPTTLGLLRAMAHQLGLAVADTWLLERLERALHAKSEFLNTMSHELRSPLHVVLGYADMLREGDIPPAEAGEHIRASGLELLRLVEDTMTASQLEVGRLPVRLDEFEASALVAELADCVHALPEAQHGTPVRWHTDDDLPALRLDRLKVKEIVQNLVSNALKFTLTGEVRVRLARDGDDLCVMVEDDGVGIPAEAHGRIFEMFERLESPDRGRPPGVGLGLYIVARLVRLMDGSVALESAPGRGSRFTVRLPLDLDRAAA